MLSPSMTLCRKCGPLAENTECSFALQKSDAQLFSYLCLCQGCAWFADLMQHVLDWSPGTAERKLSQCLTDRLTRIRMTQKAAGTHHKINSKSSVLFYSASIVVLTLHTAYSGECIFVLILYICVIVWLTHIFVCLVLWYGCGYWKHARVSIKLSLYCIL